MWDDDRVEPARGSARGSAEIKVPLNDPLISLNPEEDQIRHGVAHNVTAI
jgi:hypothetical protein